MFKFIGLGSTISTFALLFIAFSNAIAVIFTLNEVPRNINLAEAPSFGKSVLSYEPNAKGSLAYLALAGELIGKTEEQYSDNAYEQRQI